MGFEETQRLVSEIQGKFANAKLFEPFIRYIEFPIYKTLEPGSRLTFDFPITFLVGGNGTNKTSVLQALYGCPDQSSTGNYWFSTDVDEIIDRNQYFYGYYHKQAKKMVEILKTRIQRDNNPDYWEPARPRADGMMEYEEQEFFIYNLEEYKYRFERFLSKSINSQELDFTLKKQNELCSLVMQYLDKQSFEKVNNDIRAQWELEIEELLDRKYTSEEVKHILPIISKGLKKEIKAPSRTRWNIMQKHILYEDCKEYMSAYDLLFYHTEFIATKTLKSRADFVRHRSKHLAEAISNSLKSFTFYKKERIINHLLLDTEAIKTVEKIMGKEYKEIRIIFHTFYTTQPAYSIIITQQDGHSYSEAFAGTGESRLILLVWRIKNANPKSLILIDEPEISLHPSAIKEFKLFLLREVLTKSHQIVVSTHSPTLIRDIPPEALKLLELQENQQVRIKENLTYHEIFDGIGHREEGPNTIYVEDDLVKTIVEIYLKQQHPNLFEKIKIFVIPGGAKTIIKNYISPFCFSERSDSFFLLDGDQNFIHKYDEDISAISKAWINDSSDKVNPSLVAGQSESVLHEIIKEITGVSLSFKSDGSSGTSAPGMKAEMKKKFLEYWDSNVLFLNNTTPERALLESYCEEEYDSIGNSDGKEYFRNRALKASLSDDAASVLYEQRRMLVDISVESPLFARIKEIVDTLVQQGGK